MTDRTMYRIACVLAGILTCIGSFTGLWYVCQPYATVPYTLAYLALSFVSAGIFWCSWYQSEWGRT